MAPLFDNSKYAAVILAGGDGVRLSAFTREVFGYCLPKQFCPLFGGKTLLEQTMHRVSLLVPPSRTITVLNCAHERFYSPIVAGTDYGNLYIQPENRGTAPAITGALLRLIERGHTGAMAMFPSDHYVSDDLLFMRHVLAGLHAVELSPRQIVLLGITPDGPETDYGWIEPCTPTARAHPAIGQISRIRRFWEKPSPSVARDLYDSGYLWNSFIVVANAETLLTLIARALPEIYLAFTRVRSLLAANQKEVLQTIYRELPSVDFSDRVLAKFPSEFSVLRVAGVGWSDLGQPKRVRAVMSDNSHIFSGRSPNVPGSQPLATPSGQQPAIGSKAFPSQR